MKSPIIRLTSLLMILFMTARVYAVDDKHYHVEKRIVLQQGLSQSRIQCILEDDRGFMWFGTADGLNRYDGYSTKIFRNKVGDSTSIPNNIVNSMVEDQEGNIWIGTNNGMAIFNPYSEKCISLAETDSTLIGLGANLIKSCVIDHQQNIWCGTNGYGVFKIDAKTHQKQYLFYDSTDSFFLNNVFELFIDSENRLWIGGFPENKIPVYLINNDSLVLFDVEGIIQQQEKGYKVTSFYEDQSHRIWMSIVDYYGQKGGLYYLEMNGVHFNDYKSYLSHLFLNQYRDSYNAIISIAEDSRTGKIIFGSILSGVFTFQFGETPKAYYSKSPVLDPKILSLLYGSNNILWIGTNGYGVEFSIPNSTFFHQINNKTTKGFTIESIRAFTEDSQYYWVGGYYGLAKMDKDFNQFETIFNSSVFTLANNNVDDNLLLIGSEGGGVQFINKKNHAWSQGLQFDSQTQKLSVRYIQKIFHVSDTLMLIGAFNGLFSVNPKTTATGSFPFHTSPISSTYLKVQSISKVNHGKILIGYADGTIGQVDLDKKQVVTFELMPKIQKYINYNPINCIYQNDQDIYWVATTNGLLEVSPDGSQIRFFTEEDGLPNSHIYGILPDDDDNLWLSTNNGISCYNQKENVFRNYDMSDGLQNNEFNTGAYYKAKNGNLFFGGINGFNYFNPEEIKQNSIVPHIEITGIKIANNTLILTKEQWAQHRLTIQPDEEVFTIEFAGLSYVNSDKNQYKYRIKEVNPEWVNLGSQHQITFNSMSPGKYTLEILAANNHGYWLQKPYQFTIEVLPAFFESSLFFLLLTILLVLIVLTGVKLRLRQLNHQKKKLQLYADKQTANLRNANKTLKDEIIKHKITAEKLHASNETKDKFLSIIGHDLIGPLGVIQGFSELLCDKEDDFSEQEKKSFIQTINQTSKELNSLLINLLQWSKLKSDTIPLTPGLIHLKQVINDTVLLLKGNIERKNIHLQIDIATESTVFIDKNILSTILRNLLSNAIKFTPQKGQITIKSETKGPMEAISVIDSGIGISVENQAKILNPGINFSTKGTNNESGTGIGLGLVNEFVTLSHGKIKIVSEPGNGTTFEFTIPNTEPT